MGEARHNDPSKYKSKLFKKSKRKCLCCEGEFMSLGKHNRICEKCKRDPYWRYGKK